MSGMEDFVKMLKERLGSPLLVPALLSSFIFYRDFYLSLIFSDEKIEKLNKLFFSFDKDFSAQDRFWLFVGTALFLSVVLPILYWFIEATVCFFQKKRKRIKQVENIRLVEYLEHENGKLRLELNSVQPLDINKGLVINRVVFL